MSHPADPPAGAGGAGGPDPADGVTLDESVGIALRIVLASLGPAERDAFLLHDVFGYRCEEIAELLGRTPAATRELAARARRALTAGAALVPERPALSDARRRRSGCWPAPSSRRPG